MALSDAKLRAMLKGHDDKVPRKVSDRDGLSVLWRSTGTVSFILRYRIAGRQKDLVIGSYTGQADGITLSAAREKARQCKGWLAEGRDPAIELRLIKDAHTKPVTVRDCLEHWLTEYAAERRANADKHRQQFEKWVYPAIGRLPVADCETRHWLKVFDAYKKVAPVAAGHVLQNAKQALKFCRVRRFVVDALPGRGTYALDDLTTTHVGKKAAKRDRVLSLDELRDVQRYAEENELFYYAKLLRLLLAFGCRTGEARLSRISEWNLQDGTWTSPKEHTKSGRAIVRPIPDEMIPVIEQWIVDAKDADSDFLLAEEKRSDTVSQWLRGLWEQLGHAEPWTAHDIRRSVASHLTAAGISPHVIEIVLGHSLPGVMAHYIHDHRLNEQRAALGWLWQILHSAPQENVTPIRGSAVEL